MNINSGGQAQIDALAPYGYESLGTGGQAASTQGGLTYARSLSETITPTNQNTGGGQAHNNIPPTLSNRYWRRYA